MRSPNAEKPATERVNGLQEFDLAGQLDNSVANKSSPKTQATSKWRSTYKVHPAADAFPMLSDDELQKLGEDISANGLNVPLAFCWVESGTPAAHRVLIDGRNRLEAMERVGIRLQPQSNSLPGRFREKETAIIITDGDPVAHIISLNIHRRHLTKQEQADLIVAAIKAGQKHPQVGEVSKGGRGKGQSDQTGRFSCW
jgi:hypothetical protein